MSGLLGWRGPETYLAVLLSLAIPPNGRNPDDTSVSQQLHYEKLFYRVNQSARYADGQIAGVFVRDALINPQTVCYLSYFLDVDSDQVRVERERGRAFVEIAA